MKNKPVVIISGASRGVGASVACWLATKGAGMMLIARSEDALSEISDKVRQAGGTPLATVADVSDQSVCQRAVEKTLAHFGRLDALICNAGVLPPLSSVATADPDAWRYNVAVNLLGPFYLAHSALPELRKQKGRIVNVSSGAAMHPIFGGSAYCASKAALNQFTAVLAAEEPSVTAIAMRPGVVDTEMQAFIREQGKKTMPSEQLDYYLELRDKGLLEPPSVPARAIAWLALYAPCEWSGKFLSYDEPRISQPALEIFGMRKTGLPSPSFVFLTAEDAEDAQRAQRISENLA